MKYIKKTVFIKLACLMLMAVMLFACAAAASAETVAKIGAAAYDTLGEAVAAANAMDVGAGESVKIELVADLELKEKLTISKNMIISGDYTIYRTNDYLGQMFSVPAGVKLVLEDLTIDGNNHWEYKIDKLKNDIQTMAPVSGGGYEAYAIFEEGAPVGTGTLIGVGGEVVVDGATIQNHAGTGLFWVGGKGKLDLTDTLIDHNTKPSGSVVVGVDAGGVLNINEGCVISNHFGDGNGLLGVIYGKAYINGGEFFNNGGNNCNGYIFMIYAGDSYCEMNGGYIHDNFGAQGWSNGWNCAFYVYGNGSEFVMNGGIISGNYSSSIPGIGNNGDNAKLTFNGGTLNNTHSQRGIAAKDMSAYANVNMNNTVNMATSRYYGNLVNTGTLNGDIWFYTYENAYKGGGTVNGNVGISNGAETTFESGTWNGVVTVNAVGADSTLTVKAGATIKGGPVRVRCSVDGASSENAAQAAAAQAAAFVEESGANVNVPVLYYHRLISDQKSDIVITYDYNGGMDEQGWSGIQRTGSGTSYTMEPLPQPKKDGYVLAGWMVAKDQSAESLDMTGTTAYVPGTAATKSTRYVARWTRVGGANEYTATFVYEGEVPENAPAVPAVGTYEEGETVILPVLEMDGYTFVWDISVLDDGKMPAGDVVIRGTWTPIPVDTDSLPKTGDASNLMLWCALLAASCLAFEMLYRRKCRN